LSAESDSPRILVADTDEYHRLEASIAELEEEVDELEADLGLEDVDRFL